MENALAEGKSVLVARETVFNPLVGFQPGSIFGGDYRPPLTYWLHRDTQSQLVLGSSSAKEGRGRLLTGDYSFFIIEPGYYRSEEHTSELQSLMRISYAVCCFTKKIKR